MTKYNRHFSIASGNFALCTISFYLFRKKAALETWTFCARFLLSLDRDIL